MIVRRAEARLDRATPEQIALHGDYHALLYSDTGGLTAFGAFVEVLAPGAQSSDRHWHEAEDEFLYMLDGEAVAVEEDGDHPLRSGDCACWPAGIANAHHVVNRSDRPCSYLIVGSRLPSDTVHYAEVDRLYTRRDGLVTRTRRDGSPL